MSDNEHAALRGKVVVANATLRAKNSGRECVYWSMSEQWGAAPSAHESVDFWLEDASGRVLVLGAHLRVDAHGERGRRVVEAVEADLAALGARLAEIKHQLRLVQGPDAAKLQRERRQLAQLATYLLATKAHAKGRVHVGKSMQGQAQWLAQNAALSSVDGFGMRTAQLTRDVWEVVIEPGQEVTIRGPCAVELLPPEHGRDGGYRAASSGRVLRGASTSPLLLTVDAAGSPPTSGARSRATEANSVNAGRFADEAARRNKRRASWYAAVSLVVLAAVSVTIGLLLPR